MQPEVAQPEVAVIADAADDATAISLVLDYPYVRHPGAFWFADGAVGRPVDREVARSGRIPVVAYGSNASPLQIARKFAGRPCGDRVYVEPVSLVGWDVVYAARITRYGAIPARLMAAAECRASVHLTWLTPSQLLWMDQTEGRMYRRAALGAAAVIDADGNPVTRAEAYLEGGTRLLVDGLNAALAAIAATGRSHPGHATRALHQRLARAAGFDGAVEDFALRIVRRAGYAAEILPLLRRGL